MGSFASSVPSVRTTRSIFRHAYGGNGDELAAGTQDAVCAVCSARRGSHLHRSFGDTLPPRVRDPYQRILFENRVCCPEPLRVVTMYVQVCMCVLRSLFLTFLACFWCVMDCFNRFYFIGRTLSYGVVLEAKAGEDEL
jgi:hypothetical protein